MLRVRPVTAELWDGPAYAAVAAFELAKARITGAKPNLGENRKVSVKMCHPAPRRWLESRLVNLSQKHVRQA